MKEKTDKQLFEHGRALYKQRRWKESLDVHLELIANGVHAGDGFYGIALVRLAHRDLANARIQLLNCVRLQPNHANAHFYLGEIARMRGEHTVAVARYRRALAAHQGHRSARQRLSALERHAALVTRHPSRTSVKHQPVMRPAVAHRSKAIIPIQPSPADLLVGRIRALTFTGRQRLAPFALNLLVRCLIAFALVWIATQSLGFGYGIRSIEVRADLPTLLTALIICGGGLVLLSWLKEKFKPGQVLRLAGIIIAAPLAVYLSAVFAGVLVGGAPNSPAPIIFQWFFLAAIMSIPLILTAKTTVCSIRDGWIRIVTGIFRRIPVAIPIYQLQPITLNQSGLERLSGDGDLVFQFTSDAGQPSTSSVRGIGKLADLRTLVDQANGIANDLKAGTWRSGVNYFWGPTGSVRQGLASLVANRHIIPQVQTARRTDKPMQKRRGA